jgi:succinylarginine dihydrolase
MASASAMWAANAATVSPAPDTADRRLHFTPANLVTTLHRSIEARQTERALKAIFPEPSRFAVHSPLHAQGAFADEGAANHVRLCAEHGASGVELFVFGRGAFETYDGRFPARQTREACEAIARAHGLDPKRVVIARQSQFAIEAGAFHNDVVCVGNGPVLFFHEMAFEDRAGVLEAVRRAAQGLFEPVFLEVADAEVPIRDAISSYLFNSQLLTWPGEDRQVLLSPREVEETTSTRVWCERMTAGNGPIGRVEYAYVRQSMRNGGGPACLRLRVVLTEADQAKVNPRALLDAERIDTLSRWVEAHYRDSLAPEDLRDPGLIDETRRALDDLTQILGLGTDFYPFQRG